MEKSFLGTGWGFPPEFNIERKDVVLVDDFEDIHQSLQILLSTRPGERLLNPLFGCRIHDLVFESIDESTKVLAIESIRHAILFFEARITLNQVIIDSSEIHKGILLFRIDYIIRTTNTRSNMVFPFYLKEGTLL